MVGLIKNNTKVPFISLESFINASKYQAAKEELENYKIKQDTEGLEIFVGYNGTDWISDKYIIYNLNPALASNSINWIFS